MIYHSRSHFLCLVIRRREDTSWRDHSLSRNNFSSSSCRGQPLKKIELYSNSKTRGGEKEMQTARQYVKMLGGKETWDTDYDIDSEKVNCKKLAQLQNFGFKLYFFSTNGKSGVHIHAPERKKKSWFNRGWSDRIKKEF